VRHRRTGVVERVSVGSGGAEANGHSYYPSISAEGRYVAFSSDASNLVPGDTNNRSDIFVYDRETGSVTSYASNLVAGDTNGEADVFLYDRQAGTLERVSVGWDGAEANRRSGGASLSSDGRYVAFMSYAANLVPDDGNEAWDVFVRDRQGGTIERVSVASAGTEGNGDSYWPAISADGQYIAFHSCASNLVADDTNGATDVFVYDRQTGIVALVSLAADGTQGDGNSYRPAISGDGRYVAFGSEASKLVPADTNGQADVFVHDRQTGLIERVSVSEEGTEGNGWSRQASISGEGRYAAFASEASNLVEGDTNDSRDVFVCDLWGGDMPPYIALGEPAEGAKGSVGSGYNVARAKEDPFVLLDSRPVDGALIWVYDIDPSDGLSAPAIAWSRADFRRGVTDILVNPGRIGDGVIRSIVLRGDGTQTADLGIVVEGNAALMRFTDLRRGAAPPLGFLLSDGVVGGVSLRAGIEGADLSGFTAEGGWTLPGDVDGDGATDDLTGFYSNAGLRRLVARGDVNGDIVMGGDLNVLGVIRGDLKADVTSKGHEIGRVFVRGGLSDCAIVARTLRSVAVRGSIDRTSFEIEGLFGRLHSGGDLHDSSINARELNRVWVRGSICGDDGEIRSHSLRDEFFIRDQGWRGWIEEGHDNLFDGVRAWVGGTVGDA